MVATPTNTLKTNNLKARSRRRDVAARLRPTRTPPTVAAPLTTTDTRRTHTLIRMDTTIRMPKRPRQRAVAVAAEEDTPTTIPTSTSPWTSRSKEPQLEGATKR